jgi:PAS domain S-box-containing protein
MGMYVYSTALFLVFTAAFGFLFYYLEELSFSFEREKVDRDIQILTSAFQTTLLDNERFFLLTEQIPSDGGQSVLRWCQRYLVKHPEIVAVEARTNDAIVAWNIFADSAAENFPRMSGEDSNRISHIDSSIMVLYSKPFRSNKGYYFELRIPVTEKGISSGTISVFYSAEKLLGAVLQRVPMKEYEISLFSGLGQGIASTGFSNAVASLRIQRAVVGYGRLLSVEIANPNYVFWTAEVLFGAALCGVLCLAVFAITLFFRLDITKLRAAESSLRGSEERFRTIFENSVDAMRLMDRYGRIVMANSAYCDLLRASHEELLREYKAGDENLDKRYSANSAFRTQFDAGTLKMPASQLLARRDGEKVPVEISHSFVNVGKNEKLLLSIFRDVSERKKYELESQQIQKMDALGAFAVGIGNNLKNIVGIVMNSAEVINKEAAGNPLLAQYVEMILRESKRASALADDLLVFARSKTGEEKPIPTEKVLRQIQKILEHSLSPSITLTVTANDNSSVVKGDIHQLHQAIVNLALDAQRRMPSGGTISIEAAAADPDFVKRKISFTEGKEFIVINVFDNGGELDEYSRRRIFEPFFNAKTTDQGEGLRLSVVYGIVQNHGGFIDVKSVKGKGTTFSLFLPVLYHEKAKDKEDIVKTPMGGTECVLIVDDEESFRQIYEHGLSFFGYTVHAAQDGDEALALYEKRRSEIDLVVSDLMMPRMNGEELYRRLRAINPSVKMILATGAIDLKAKTEFLEMGVSEIIMKPFLLDELMGAVRKVLDTQ